MRPGDLAYMAFYSSALMICLTCLIFTFIQSRTDKPQNKIYISMIFILTLNSVCGMAGAIFVAKINISQTAYFICEVFQFLYFLSHAALCPVFAYYVLNVTGAAGRLSRKLRVLFFVPLAVCELFVVTNPFTQWVYYYDENHKFNRNWGETTIYAAAILYFVCAIFNLLITWNAMTNKRRLSLLYFIGIVVAGTAVQLLYIDVKCELFCESLGLLGVMLTIEDEDEWMDSDIGIYNRRGLRVNIRNYIENKQRLFLLVLRITNAHSIQRVTGTVNTEKLAIAVTNYLLTHVKRYHIHHPSTGSFVITYMSSDINKAAHLAETISARFEKPWKYKDSSVLLKAVVMMAEMPIDVKSTEEVFAMADTPIPAKNDKKILYGKDLDFLMRKAAVESAIHRGLEEHNFEVYYQPTYTLKNLRLHGAEALIRLHDSQLGNLFPDEFIPAAEQIGLIDEIDDFVLREVCAFMKSGTPQKYGIDVINVNLSVIQCMRPGFVEHINSIVEECGTEKSTINFEITESVAASDYDVLSSVVKQLKKSGFKFSMDDYGTGYSNMQSIFSLDFDVIKIDKSILWGAEKSELGHIILENSVRMIKQMERKILVEGVETTEQIELLKGYSVDYLQGYYFSRPVPKDEFISVISK